MPRLTSWLCGAASGAMVQYFFDPDRGRRRRALLRDQLRGQFRQFELDLGRVWRDMTQRGSGYVHEAAVLLHDERPDDHTLVARVRSKLGRYVSNPGAIQVRAEDGCVCLSGHVFRDELPDLISNLQMVRGVRSLQHDLQAHDPAENVPDLQRRRNRLGERANLFEERWAPSTRALIGLSGGALLSYGLSNRNPIAVFVGATGAALMAAACLPSTLRPGGSPSQRSRNSGGSRQAPARNRESVGHCNQAPD